MDGVSREKGESTGWPTSLRQGSPLTQEVNFQLLPWVLNGVHVTRPTRKLRTAKEVVWVRG